jgi:hypothetical protein
MWFLRPLWRFLRLPLRLPRLLMWFLSKSLRLLLRMPWFLSLLLRILRLSPRIFAAPCLRANPLCLERPSPLFVHRRRLSRPRLRLANRVGCASSLRI